MEIMTTLGWKRHTQAVPSWYFQPQVVIFSCPTHYHASSVNCRMVAYSFCAYFAYVPRYTAETIFCFSIHMMSIAAVAVDDRKKNP